MVVEERITVAAIASKRSKKRRTGGKHGSMVAARRSSARQQVRLWPESWSAWPLGYVGEFKCAAIFYLCNAQPKVEGRRRSP